MDDNVVLSVIIPTYSRPHLLPRAVASVLGQTARGIELVIVDDCSPQPVQPEDFPEARVIRLAENAGLPGARNAGARAARGRWLSFLDDDDEYLPHFAAVSLTAARQSVLPGPVAVISGLENTTPSGAVRRRALPPPSLRRGTHFALDEVPAAVAGDVSYNSKQTLMVERDVFLRIGGFDEHFRTREYTEFFLRLSDACSIQTVREVTYRRYVHDGPRLSSASDRRQLDFRKLLEKHRDLLAAHPRGYARLLYEHAYTSYRRGQVGPALRSFAHAMRIHPAFTTRRAGSQSLQALRGLLGRPVMRSTPPAPPAAAPDPGPPSETMHIAGGG